MNSSSAAVIEALRSEVTILRAAVCMQISRYASNTFASELQHQSECAASHLAQQTECGACDRFVSKARTCATTITAKLNQRAPELMLCGELSPLLLCWRFTSLVLADICNQSLNNTVVLPCNHRFCLPCINKFVCLASGMQCAVCHRHIVFTHEQIQLPSSRPEQAVRGLFLGHGAPPLTDGTDTKRQKLEAHYPDPYRQPDSNTPDTNLINITPELEPYFSMDSVNSAVAAPNRALNGGADNGRLHPSIADGIQTSYRSMQAEPLDRCAQQLNRAWFSQFTKVGSMHLIHPHCSLQSVSASFAMQAESREYRRWTADVWDGGSTSTGRRTRRDPPANSPTTSTRKEETNYTNSDSKACNAVATGSATIRPIAP